MGIFSKKSQTSIGVDFGVGGLKIVELKNMRGRAHLATYAFMQGGWGAELEEAVGILVGSLRSVSQKGVEEWQLKKIGAVLKQLIKKSGVQGRSAVASIPSSAVFNAVVSVPKVSEKDFGAQVKIKAVKLLPMPIEEMALDFQNIDGERALVTATSNILVDDYTKIFKYAGLQLVNLETESVALIRALLGKDRSPAFILDIGTVRTNLFVVRGSVPIINRSINVGGKHFNALLNDMWDIKDAGLIEQAKLDISRALPSADMPQVFFKILDPIVQELKYNIELFDRENADGVRPVKIILTGGSSFILGLTRFLEKIFNITTYIGDPWARVVYPQALKPALDAIGPRFAVAVGLAARNM